MSHYKFFWFFKFFDEELEAFTHVAGIAVKNAPGCGVASVKILDANGRGGAAELLAGLQWVITNRYKYNIRIINMSVGTSLMGGEPIVKAVETAWDKGIVICAAAGNNGPGQCTITTPGTSRKIITVGASDDFNTVDIWGSRMVNFSGRGPTKDCIVKPDIIAPGTNILSVSNKGNGLRRMSGTSMSTPAVSGAVALLLEKNPNLSPNEVKYMLKQSAKNLFFPKNQQGWGALDIKALLEQEVSYG